MASVVESVIQNERADIEQLGPWFHNLHLPDGRQTAPDHFLGDFPRKMWRRIRRHIPESLAGWTALDVGCNAGFYSFKLARRGAQVTAIDREDLYLRQAEWAAEKLGLQRTISFQRKQVYDLGRDDAAYDLVWFMGVFYHLRYPLLALDILARKVRRMLVFQTMMMPGNKVLDTPDDLNLGERHRMLDSGWPRMAFIEKRLADDPTNWWAPNHACVEAMLRSCGLHVVSRPASETYICVPKDANPAGAQCYSDEQYLAIFPE